MAKAREIRGIAAGDAYGSVARRVITVRADEVRAHATGVLDTTDIERVHAMRVATRRLRAALEVFKPCFPKREFKAALRDVKALADALGERRDRDVAIVALGEIRAEAQDAEGAAVDSLLRGLEDERERANAVLAGFVTADRLREFGVRLSVLTADPDRAAG